jgi:hypothetical protein
MNSYLKNANEVLAELEFKLFGRLYKIIWLEDAAQEIYKGANEDYLFNNRSTITELINEKIS